MKLLSHIAKVVNGVEYPKFWINIPNTVIEALGWKKGQELEHKVERGKLIISKKKKG